MPDLQRRLADLPRRTAARARRLPDPAVADAVGARFRRFLVRLETPTWLGLGLALVAWLLISAFAEPYGRLWGTGQDARSYWAPVLSDPYANADWTTPAAYPYAPVFLQLLEPIRALPWQAFVGAWTAILIACVRFLTGPRLFAAGLVFAAMELAGGNVSLLIAAGAVLGFRFAGTWAFAALTKVTPAIGLLWFLVRGEWRPLVVAGLTTIAIVGVSFATMPDAWLRWPQVLAEISGRGGTWAAVPIPLVIRLPIAALVIAWGAVNDRRWTVPVGAMLALPALWYGGFSILLAVIPLRDAGRRASDPVQPAATSGTVAGRERATSTAPTR